MVRPHFEYCSAVWSPHYVKDKALLEKVQHRFVKGRIVQGAKRPRLGVKRQGGETSINRVKFITNY